MKLRISLSVLFFASIFLFPWYISVLLSVVLLVLFNAYEVILGGLLLDTLYGTPILGYFDSESLFTLLFVILYILSFYIKKQLIFYHELEVVR